MLTEDMVKYLKDIIPETLKENPSLFESKDSPNNWYDSREFFLKTNQIFLEKIKHKLEAKFRKEISLEELFCMQKLFLIYPDYIPKKLLSLPWDTIKIILNLCEPEKRKFYTDLSLEKKLDASTLIKYILNDVYEKTLVVMDEVKDYNTITSYDFLDKILNIYPMVWE